MRDYLPFTQKDCSTHKHDFVVYVKGELLFARDLSLENSADFHLCFRLGFLLVFLTGFTSLSALLLFPLSITSFGFVYGF